VECATGVLRRAGASARGRGDDDERVGGKRGLELEERVLARVMSVDSSLFRGVVADD